MAYLQYTKNIMLSIFLLFTIACNKVEFSETQLKMNETVLPILDTPPVDLPTSPEPPMVNQPPVVDNPPPIDLPEPQPPIVTLPPSPQPPSTSVGVCQNGQAISSCLSCQAPPVQQWKPSTKAEKLAHIMYMSCSIHNKSDPPMTKVPTLEEALSLVQACTAEAYPETPLSAQAQATINALLDVNNDWLRQKIFSGIWYQPPYTDHFDNYFGVYHADIKPVFCFGEDHSVATTGNLLTTEEAQACFSPAAEGTFDCGGWLYDKNAQARWQAVQTARAQLRECMAKSATMNKLPPNSVTGKQPTCEYRSFQGLYGFGGASEVQFLISNGYTLSIEQGASCTSTLPSGLTDTSLITVTGYRCL